MKNSQVMLDTCIVSYLMRGGNLAKLYAPHVEGKLLAISFITVGEMYYGAIKAQWGLKRRHQLEITLRSFVVIPYDNKIALKYGQLVFERQQIGKPIAPHDAWIAACAVRYNIPLVTHNPKDFKGITGLTIFTEHYEN